MEAVLIRNPISGNPDRQYALALAVEELRRARWKLDIRQTEYKGHARELAAAAVREGYRQILVAGGDGSIGQATDGIVSTGVTDVYMGIIPLGTGNVFARDVGLPYPKSRQTHAPLEAARIILQGSAVAIDVGIANGQAFMSWSGCGIDAVVTDLVETQFAFNKRQSPISTYTRAVLRMLTRYSPSVMRVEADGETFEGYYYLAVASNISLYARYIRLAPEAYLDDGLLDLFLVDAKQLSRFLYTSAKAVTPIPSVDPRIVRRPFRRLRLETEDHLPYHLDGDPLGQAPLQIEVLPRHLKVYLDPNKTKQRLISP
ncbi:MAG: YegS/Rv2252/BmrU family lipid kinase [Caldilineales bacterium]|nr:YegS/Rv2252/BmrU family lipid kinase [Caldilineales bacterium]